MLPEDYANVKDQVAYCGLRCGGCNLGNGTVAGKAIDLMSYLKQYDVASWANQTPGGSEVDFEKFGQNLVWVSQSLKCPGCLKGGGNPECPIRLCAKDKGFSSCGQCADLVKCSKFDWLGEGGKKMKSELAESQAIRG